MKLSLLRWLLAAGLLAALVGEAGRGRHRLGASVLLNRCEMVSLQARQAGAAGKGVLQSVLNVLRAAGEANPVEVGVPIATGSVHLLLGSPQAAIGYYQQALELEKRPETYLNLGRAQQAMGDLAAAKESYGLALKLDPLLAPQVPDALRPAAP